MSAVTGTFSHRLHVRKQSRGGFSPRGTDIMKRSAKRPSTSQPGTGHAHMAPREDSAVASRLGGRGLENALGYEFQDPQLLSLALTHSSYIY